MPNSHQYRQGAAIRCDLRCQRHGPAQPVHRRHRTERGSVSGFAVVRVTTWNDWMLREVTSCKAASKNALDKSPGSM